MLNSSFGVILVAACIITSNFKVIEEGLPREPKQKKPDLNRDLYTILINFCIFEKKKLLK